MNGSIFSDEFVRKLPADPWDAAVLVTGAYFKVLHARDAATILSDAVIVDIYGFLSIFFEHHPELELPAPVIPPEPPERNNALAEVMNKLARTAENHIVQVRVAASRQRYSAALSKDVVYTFSDKHYSRLQDLLGGLRTLISGHPTLLPAHKHRLLRRLESLQTELRKTMANLDRFWGLVAEAGVVQGKLGAEARPLVERIREIAQIVWSTQAVANGLAEGAAPPLVPGATDLKMI